MLSVENSLLERKQQIIGWRCGCKLCATRSVIYVGGERNSRRKKTRMDASEDRKRQEEMEIFWRECA